jgi:hypothetical protein
MDTHFDAISRRQISTDLRRRQHLVTAIAHMLPKRQMGPAELAEVIERRYRNRTAAKDAHRRNQARSDSSWFQATNDGP